MSEDAPDPDGIELRVFWPNAIQFIEITRERWTVLTLEGDQSSAMPKFTDSPLEESGFELVWGFSCQVVVFGLLPVLCLEREGRSSSHRLRSGSRSARKGSRDRNASTAWRLAAQRRLRFGPLTLEHAERL
jgi:hypothetical protein